MNYSLSTTATIAQAQPQPVDPPPLSTHGGIYLTIGLTIAGAIGGYLSKELIPKVTGTVTKYVESKEQAEAKLLDRLLEQVFTTDKENLNRMIEAMHSDNARLHDAIIALSESVKLQTKTIEVSVQGTMAGQAGLYAEHSERLGSVIDSQKALHTRLDTVVKLQESANNKMEKVIEALGLIAKRITTVDVTPQPSVKSIASKPGQ